MKKILFLLFLFLCTGVSAQTHDANWYYAKGVEYSQAKNHDQAIIHFKKANELCGGNKNCQSNIGLNYYLKGDYTEAVNWLRKAAEQGEPQAQFNLGYCYDCGEGVGEDDTQAVYWFRKAAEQGFADAQYNLGYCYSFGTGVEENRAQGVYWFRKAAAQGNANAQKALDMLNK